MTKSESGKLGAEKTKIIKAEQKKQRELIYNANPNKCRKCDKKLTYDKKDNLFCSRYCAISVNNLGVKRHSNENACQYCGQTTKYKFCSDVCYKEHVWKNLTKEIEQNGFTNLAPFSRIPKRYLLRTRGHKCEVCNLAEWNGQPIPIVLDHINCNAEDLRINNLRLICCNCDAQTPTYKSKNKGQGRHYRRKRYSEGKSY